MASEQEIIAELQRRNALQPAQPTAAAPVNEQAIIEELQRRQQAGDVAAPKTQPQQPFQPEFFGRGIPQNLAAASQQPQEQSINVLEPAATIATSIVAQPIGGIAGLVRTLFPGEEGAGARVTKKVTDALTFTPRSESGKQALETVAETLQPVTDVIQGAENALGDFGFRATGSPAVAAALKTAPTAFAEILGLKGTGAFKKINKTVKDASTVRKAEKALTEIAPSIDKLKDTSRAIYREIDDAGVTVRSDAVTDLTDKINKVARDAGVDPNITPASNSALARFNNLGDEPISVSDLDTLRKVAQNAAGSQVPADANVARLMIDEIDSFLDNAAPQTFLTGKKAGTEVAKKYKAARGLWKKARKAELLQDAFTRADLQASGLENGIRIQLRQILNSPKKRRFFSNKEKALMRDVVEGDVARNTLKKFGRLAVGEGQATNVLGATGGMFLGGAAAGAPGAIAVPLVGEISRRLSRRLTQNKANLTEAIVRAGPDGRKVAVEYFKRTPKKNRSLDDLSELLARPHVSLKDIPKNKFMQDAADLAAESRLNAALGITAGGAVAAIPREENQ